MTMRRRIGSCIQFTRVQLFTAAVTISIVGANYSCKLRCYNVRKLDNYMFATDDLDTFILLLYHIHVLANRYDIACYLISAT